MPSSVPISNRSRFQTYADRGSGVLPITFGYARTGDRIPDRAALDNRTRGSPIPHSGGSVAAEEVVTELAAKVLVESFRFGTGGG